MRLFVLVSVLIISATCFSQDRDPNDFVAMAQWGWSDWTAITESGEFFWYRGVVGWEYIGNVSDMAGHAAAGNFIGLSFWNESQYGPCTPTNCCALTDNGDYYWSSGTSTWNYEGNVQELAGHIPECPFTTLSFSAHPGAMTKSGELYVKIGTEWQYREFPVAVDSDSYLDLVHQSHPNPFNPSTTISFELKSAQHVRLAVYTLAGELIATLVNMALPTGPHELTWDGRDNDGQEIASGVYFFRLESGKEIQTGKMVLVSARPRACLSIWLHGASRGNYLSAS